MSIANSGGQNSHINDGNGNGNRPKKAVTLQSTPVLRVGLLEGFERVDFHLKGSFDICTLSGDVIYSGIESELRWRSKIEESTSSVFTFNVLLKSFAEKTTADSIAEQLVEKGYQAFVIEIGEQQSITGKTALDSRKFRLVVGQFDTEDECTKYIDEFSEEYSPRVIREVKFPSTGKIEFYDAEYDRSGIVDDGFRLVPVDDKASVTIHDVRVGTGYHWEKAVDRKYPGILEIRVDHEGKLSAINEVQIDQYLKGVVPSEMPAAYPMDALKAQAVAARSDALSKIFAKHVNDPFHLCATVHCQVYSGITDYNERTSKAVEATAGEVLTFEGKVCDAVYSSVCGGHTENKENVWNSPGESYLNGIMDSKNGDAGQFNLKSEKDVLRWINSKPPVYCNVDAHKTPSTLNGAVKYFRWEETFSRLHLEDIIRKKTGVDIGKFYGIVPIKRGESGRLIEIEILGSRKNHKIKKELNIRRSLSENTLRSSCFYITMTYDKDGIPAEITFHGAGWGHGVGMCQVGAAVMAEQGASYNKILKHYYPKTVLKTIYTIDNSNTPKKIIEEKVLEN